MKTSIMAVCVIFLISIHDTLPQDRDSLIQLSESLGDTIDYNEMQAFNILNLKDFKGFHQLVLFVRNDTTLAAVISYEDEAGSLEDSTLLYNVRALANLRASFRQAKIESVKNFEKRSGVIITNKHGINYKGVIESINENELTLAQRTPGTNDHSIPDFTLKTFHKDEIGSVFIEGESKVLSGLGYGGLAGFLTGALIGLASGDDDPGILKFSAGAKALIGGVALGVIGSAVGLVAGLISSTDDSVITIDSDDNFRSLDKYVQK